MKHRHLWLAAGIAAGAAGSAQALQPASFSYFLNPGGGMAASGTTTGRHTVTAGGGFASVASGGTPLTYALVHAHTTESTSNPNGYYEPSASADFEYDYQASLVCAAGAACASAPVAPSSPVVISGYVGSQVTGGGSFVSIQIGDAYGVSFYCYEGGADCGTKQFAYGATPAGTITAGPNGSYTIGYVGHMSFSVTALANTLVSTTQSNDAYGYVDPLIAFDPAVFADGFTAGTIELSPGAANASAPPPAFGGTVPEPASWALLVAGFGLTGAALRRRSPVRAG